MEAKEAKEISKNNQMAIDECFKIIKNSAEAGNTQCQLFSISNETGIELMKLGYKMSIHTDVYNGIETNLCSW